MKIIFSFLLLLSVQTSFAFEATNFTGTKEEVRSYFQTLWGKFKNYDNFHCYRRAHILSYQMSKSNINSMKVFFFKGDKLKMPHDWYYHVAPMVYYKGEGLVMDKGLFEGATFLKDWLEAFGEGHACREITSMDERKKYQASEHCMYMLVPMYYYGPLSLEKLDKTDFEYSDLQDMLFSLTKRQRNIYLNQYPL